MWKQNKHGLQQQMVNQNQYVFVENDIFEQMIFDHIWRRWDPDLQPFNLRI